MTTFYECINYKDLINDKDIDVIAIATPVFTHYKMAKLALEHGKHVLIEKPMASSVEECEELIEVAEKKNLTLMVDHTFLFTGSVRKIKELIDNNELGKIYYFDSERINLGLIQNDINVIWDLAPHDISIMNYLFEGSKPLNVLATGTKHVYGSMEEMAHISVVFDSGVVGHLHVSWLSPVKIRKVLIGGSNKMVLYNDVEPSEKIKLYDKGVSIDNMEITPFKPAYRSGDVFIPQLDNDEALKVEVGHFMNCVKNNERPLIDGAVGLDVIKILEACDRSLKEGRVINL